MKGGVILFCGMRHMPDCYCVLCRTVGRGYVIPIDIKRRGKSTPAKVKGMLLAIKKESGDSTSSDVVTSFSDPLLKSSYPTLHDYLTDTKFEDGSPRVSSTLTIIADDGKFTGFLNDRHNDRSLCVESSSFNGLLNELEDGLTADKIPWKRRRNSPSSSRATPF